MTARTTMHRLALLVATILAVGVLSGCERSEVDGIGSYTPDDVAPPQLDVAMGDCSIGDWGWVTGDGTVVNQTDDVASYEVVVAFDAGEVRVGQGSGWIRDLAPGQTAKFSVSTHLGDDADSMSACDVITVNRWGAETRSTES